MSPTRVLVVEDDAAIRRLLQTALVRAGHAVIEAADARAAMAALSIDKPDAVLLDLGLPDRDGLELVPLIKATGAALIIVSAREDTDQKVTALDLGADDYVMKPFDSEELRARLRTALRHRLAATSLSEKVVLGDVEIDLSARRITRAGEDVHLTPKEYAMLVELARHPGRVITHAQLLRAVWGPGHEHDVEYLRVTARGIRRKLEADPAVPKLLRNEPGVGYRLEGQTEK
ncbi:two component transcriptional regulator [Novosphingobium nitrogenifigens DSM 19370]|uniref:Two component transcriptional regulator n=1 Tax=Novosphingobium nitrogenifigens DSM 19370 TaxID=983920 RepID=F1ZAP9_9SPHN|nr:response regulator transcription factor [Novosphingobium nitrogenifigens]EGD58314.1 two component transcriptional regulator [Novosphingobium nitrogenifigens DSM 19370]